MPACGMLVEEELATTLLLSPALDARTRLLPPVVMPVQEADSLVVSAIPLSDSTEMLYSFLFHS